MSRFKTWFNQRFPLYRLCTWPWCWRNQVYQYRCPVHWRD